MFSAATILHYTVCILHNLNIILAPVLFLHACYAKHVQIVRYKNCDSHDKPLNITFYVDETYKYGD